MGFRSVQESNEWIDSNVVTSNMKKIGQWDENYGVPIDSYIADDILYVACGVEGLCVFNITDLAYPIYLGRYSAPDSCIQNGIYVDNNDYVFVADGDNGFVVLDVSNYSDISVVTSFIPGYVRCIDIQDDLAYVGATNNLYIVNISDPTSLEQVGHYTSPSSYSEITVKDDYVYLVNHLGDLEILDSSNLSSISMKSVYVPIDNNPVTDIVFSGSYAIIATYRGDMEVVDITNKESPTLAHTVFGSTGVCAIQQKGNYLIVDGFKAVNIFDASVISSITKVATESVDNNPTGLFAKGDVLISMYYAFGIDLIDISTILNPNNVKYYSFGGKSFDVAVKGDYAYVTNMLDGLSVIDISDKTNPIRVRRVTSGGVRPNQPKEITIVGDYAYVTDQEYIFSIYDLTNPTDPTLIFTDTTGFGIGLGSAFRDNYTYVASNQDGLRIYDTTNKVSTIMIGNVNDGGHTQGVYLKGDYAFCADGSDGLEIINIADPAHPVEEANIGSRCYDVGGVWKYLLTLESAGVVCYLRIYDITIPTSPDLKVSYLLYAALNQLDIRGDWAFVSSGFGFEVINWYDLLSPSTIGTFNDGGFAYGSDIVDGYYYVANSYDGLEILTLDLPDTDSDRLPDSVETGIYGTEISNTDTDGDGLLDGEETDTSYTVPTLADTDSDGFDDYTEWINGSDPRDPTSTPVLSGPSFGIIILSTALVLTGAKIIKTKRKRKE